MREFGAIEQSIYIEASHEVVYDVVSAPEHVAQWFVDEAAYETVPGSAGHVGFGEPTHRVTVPLTVVEATPGVRFSFRWMPPVASGVITDGDAVTETNSTLVVFDLTPQGEGTLLKVTESGMRELGWEAATLEFYYNDHSEGWVGLLARAQTYAGELATGQPR